MKTSVAELSIVVPVYNRASLLERSLDSVAAQILRPLHLIVVDNGSTDDTLQCAGEWAERHRQADFAVTVLQEPRRGASAARQRGLEAVGSEYVYFLDSDDVLRPDAAALFVREFRRHPEAQIVRGEMLVHGLDSRVRRQRRRHGNKLLNHFHHSLLNTVLYAARTEFLRSAGGWNPDLRIWDDWELGMRLLLRSPIMIDTRRVILDCYVQPGSVTGDRYSDRADFYEPVLQAVEQAVRESGHHDSLRLLRLVHGRRMMLAALYAREGEMELAEKERRRVLELASADPWLCRVLRFAYHYRRLGLRGADSLVTPLL